MALKGNIEAFKLTDILKLILSNKKTGVLYLSDGFNYGRILIDDGNVIFADQGMGNIGQMLVDSKKISPINLKYVEKVKNENEGSIVKILIKQNYITRDELTKYFTKHTNKDLINLLGWNEGQFEFILDENEIIVDYSFGQNIDISPAVEEAKKRIAIWKKIEKVIPDSRAVIHLFADKEMEKNNVVLSPLEWKIVTEINGERSVSEIASACEIDKFTISKTLLDMAESKKITVTPYEPDENENESIEVNNVEPLEKKDVTEQVVSQGVENKIAVGQDNEEQTVDTLRQLTEREEAENNENIKETEKIDDEKVQRKNFGNVSDITKGIKGKNDIESVSFALEELSILSRDEEKLAAAKNKGDNEEKKDDKSKGTKSESKTSNAKYDVKKDSLKKESTNISKASKEAEDSKGLMNKFFGHRK